MKAEGQKFGKYCVILTKNVATKVPTLESKQMRNNILRKDEVEHSIILAQHWDR